eukprot:TRINITY_DN2671_c0_g1_i1.p1 TRINITY_DN2671_c0_g1~~TRINITY_DN2671_c0_g1_i1.p1  ORF type:complete len:571 (+),score=208.94 TRINITY_DN2671_c0_g1_i1:110-1822(+)
MADVTMDDVSGYYDALMTQATQATQAELEDAPESHEEHEPVAPPPAQPQAPSTPVRPPPPERAPLTPADDYAMVVVTVEAIFDRALVEPRYDLSNIEQAVRIQCENCVRRFSPGKAIPCPVTGPLRLGMIQMCVDDVNKICDHPYLGVSALIVNACWIETGSPSLEGVDQGATFFQEPTEVLPAGEVLKLPNRALLGLWESLWFDDPAETMVHPKWCGQLKYSLVRSAEASLHLSDKGVDRSLIAWNNVLLFYGPPGTGKTSICKALAQKLAIRLRKRYSAGAQLIEVNTHSLFSKYYSESGKLVMKLFAHIREIAEDANTLVFLLIDEVESLAAARSGAMSSSEPSDSIRVVNAMLTQLDHLRAYPNVITLCTSNITEAVDLAFIDRADVKRYVGPPGLSARYGVLSTSVAELCQKGVVHGAPPTLLRPGQQLQPAEHQLLELCRGLDGLSGRFLRKLPYLAAALTSSFSPDSPGVPLAEFISAMEQAAKEEQASRERMDQVRGNLAASKKGGGDLAELRGQMAELREQNQQLARDVAAVPGMITQAVQGAAIGQLVQGALTHATSSMG